MVQNKKVVIGTRDSKLALWQAEWVRTELKKIYPDLDIELKKIKTTGDKVLDVPLAKVGGKGLFVKEIEEALLSHEADIAVHSMKDVPTEFPKGLHIAVICKREDPRDAFISQIQNSKFRIQNFEDLPEGAILGTSSLRRSCQLLNVRPDLQIKQLRGNLDTRIRKLDENQFDAIILATAGVKRLGWTERITDILPPDISLPAIGQGAIGIECRLEDEYINKLIEHLNHLETSICVRAERAFLKRLEGGCQVPIAAYARFNPPSPPFSKERTVGDYSKGGLGGFSDENSKIQNPKSKIFVIDGLVGSVAGDRIVKGHIEGIFENTEPLGIALAKDLLSRGAKEILDEVYGQGTHKVNGELSS